MGEMTPSTSRTITVVGVYSRSGFIGGLLGFRRWPAIAVVDGCRASGGEGVCCCEDRRACEVRVSVAQEPGRREVVEPAVLALEPGLNHGRGVALAQQGDGGVGDAKTSRDPGCGFTSTVGPLVDGGGVDGREVGHEPGAEVVAEVADEGVDRSRVARRQPRNRVGGPRPSSRPVGLTGQVAGEEEERVGGRLGQRAGTGRGGDEDPGDAGLPDLVSQGPEQLVGHLGAQVDDHDEDVVVGRGPQVRQFGQQIDYAAFCGAVVAVA